jgi:hypothetical protein
MYPVGQSLLQMFECKIGVDPAHEVQLVEVSEQVLQFSLQSTHTLADAKVPPGQVEIHALLDKFKVVQEVQLVGEV